MDNTPQIIIGCGYHPAHTSPECSPHFMAIPKEVRYVELGLAELERHRDQSIYPGCDLSLHIARSPICEDIITQQNFCAFVAGKLAASSHQISSIGIHLTGPRTEGLGQLGFSTHFKSSESYAQKAVQFIERLKSATGLPVWLENANFYSSSAREVIQNWECTRRILDTADAQLIFDLTHCFIECHNLGLPPEFIFGLVPWNRVVEIHISGFVVGADGALHDGHSQPIKAEIWNNLEFILQNFVTKPQVIVNLEHTDLSWVQRPEFYHADFRRLREVRVAPAQPSAFSAKQLDYAISNLNRIIGLRQPEISKILSAHGYEQRTVLKEWLQKFVSGDLRLVFSKNEIPPSEWATSVSLIDGFTSYIHEELV